MSTVESMHTRAIPKGIGKIQIMMSSPDIELVILGITLAIQNNTHKEIISKAIGNEGGGWGEVTVIQNNRDNIVVIPWGIQSDNVYYPYYYIFLVDDITVSNYKVGGRTKFIRI